MKNSKNVLFCVIFPSNLKFFEEFINSAKNQTTQNFDVFIVNDGLDDNILKQYIKSLICPFNILNVKNNQNYAKIREFGINNLLSLGYENIIFADTDDLMSNNRIEMSIAALERYPIVFNDLSLIDINRNIIKNKIWSDRLSNTEITSMFLLDKNVIGLGNAAIKSHLLQNLRIPYDIVAVDWFIFFNAIKNNNIAFINKSETFYRQYDSNIIGIEKVTKERLFNIINVKKKHYKYIPTELLGKNLIEIEQIEKKISNPEYLQYSLNELNNKNIYYFWWEETNFLKNL